MTRKGFSAWVPCLVVQRLNVDIVLGRPWLREWNPLVDWAIGELTFSDGVKWRPPSDLAHEADEQKGAGIASHRLPPVFGK